MIVMFLCLTTLSGGHDAFSLYAPLLSFYAPSTNGAPFPAILTPPPISLHFKSVELELWPLPHLIIYTLGPFAGRQVGILHTPAWSLVAGI